MESETIAVPKFATETEEADWWFEHQDLMLENFERASAEGRLGRGTAARLAKQYEEERGGAQGSFQLDPEDAKRAMTFAARKGVSYEAYVRTLIHQALEKEPDPA